MSEFTVKTFDEAVIRYFEPIAREHCWPMLRINENTYEIKSPYCIMQVDFYQGQHTRSMNIQLIPADVQSNKRPRIGLWPIAEYNGTEFKYIPWEQTAEGFFQEAEYVANLARIFCIPYLTGEKSNWNDVAEFWREKSEKELEKIKNYKFPRNVQKRWHLPPPSSSKEK